MRSAMLECLLFGATCDAVWVMDAVRVVTRTNQAEARFGMNGAG